MEKPSKVVFKPIGQEDLDACAELYRVIYSHRPWREKWRHSTAKKRLKEVFDSPGSFGFAAWEGEDLAGFCFGTKITRSTRLSAQIAEFGVDPEWSSPRLVKAFGDYIIKKLEEQQVKSIFTMMLNDNPVMHGLAESGFHLSRHYHVLVHRMGEK